MRATAEEVIQGLVARGLPLPVAQGVAANMSVESAGFQTDINEIAPVVPGSRGGFGLNQWTGPRRRQFEAYARARGVSPSDLDTQLDFTLHELSTTEQNAMRALSGASDARSAAQIYSDKFLRPGIKNTERRLQEADRLSGVVPQEQRQTQPAPRISLPEWQANKLDPAQFTRPVNQMANVGFDQQRNPFLQYMRSANG